MIVNNKNSIYDCYYDWQDSNTNISVTDMKYIIAGQKEFNSDYLPKKINNILHNLPISSILDYGAGLGRNLPLLLKFTNNIDYIDLLNYKEKFEKNINDLEYKNKYYINDNLPDMLDKKYDLIYASVVFQHIVDNDIYEKIIKILAEKTTYLVILQNFEAPVKEIINSYFHLIECEHDVDTFKHVKHISLLYKSKL
jgi:SAM-dependent methyltransferase